MKDTTQIVDLLRRTISLIVLHPEGVVVEANEGAGRTVVTCRVDPRDFGRVVGKSGCRIVAIKNLFSTIGLAAGLPINVELPRETRMLKDSPQQYPTDPWPAETEKQVTALVDDLLQALQIPFKCRASATPFKDRPLDRNIRVSSNRHPGLMQVAQHLDQIVFAAGRKTGHNVFFIAQ